MSGENENKKRRFRGFLFVGLILVAVMASHPLYVAFYEPETHDTVIMGQTFFFGDSPAGIGILVRNQPSGAPIPKAKVSLALKQNGVDRELGTYLTGTDGRIADPIRIPDIPTGIYQLDIRTESEFGKDHVAQQIEIKKPGRIYLTTDKPVYQPGQNIHLRTLVLNRISLAPYAELPVLFEIEDPKGNKVYKKEVETSRFGIASTTFQIADHVNTGCYTIFASSDKTISKKAVTVEQYPLPKFKVGLEHDKPYYLPTDEIRGWVQADYFFGKPVSDAEANIQISTNAAQLSNISGRTDANGRFHFSLVLPELLTGPLTGGKTRIEMKATIRDHGNREQMVSKYVTVAENHIYIQVIPESAPLVSGVENRIYIITAYPDGKPAVASLSVNGQTLRSDTSGVAVFTVKPQGGKLRITVTARDKDGKTGSLASDQHVFYFRNNFILRTDKAICSGDRKVVCEILTCTDNVFFLDVIKDGRIMLTRSFSVKNKKGTYTLDMPPELFGSVKVNAYCFNEQGAIFAKSRTVFIDRSAGLSVKATLDQPVYKPGETGRMVLEVKDRQGRPTPAALGVSIVDEAVFHLCETYPGLIEKYFLVDPDLSDTEFLRQFPHSISESGKAPTDDRNLSLALASKTKTENSLRDIEDDDEYYAEGLDDLLISMDRGEYYEWLGDPRLVEVTRLFGFSEDYPFRVSTYQDKQAKTKEYRENYFRRLKTILYHVCLTLALLLGCVAFFAGIWCVTRSWLRIYSQDSVTTQVQLKQYVADMFVYSFTVLLLFPILSYLLVFILCLFWGFDIPPFLVCFCLNLYIAITLFIKQKEWVSMLMDSGDTIYMGHEYAGIAHGFICQYFVTRFVIIAGILIGHFFNPFDHDLWLELFPAGVFIVSFLIVFCLYGMCLKNVRKFLGVKLRHGIRFMGAVLGSILLAILLFAISIPNFIAYRDKSYRASAMHEVENLNALMAENMSQSVSQNGQHPRVRKYFPETLLFLPEVVTDENGKAELEIPLADSITTWRMNVDAVSQNGTLGSDTFGIKVFQDFFVDIDFPPNLTQNDEISIPVTCHNYLDHPQSVQIRLEPEEWYLVRGASVKSVTLDANTVKPVFFTITAIKSGRRNLTVTAVGEKLGDAISKTTTIRPDGEKMDILESGMLGETEELAFTIPPDAFEDSRQLLLKLYPSAFCQVVEGLDGIFKMPHGCFEQTSSCAYPNVLVLDYLKRKGQFSPEIEKKAREYIHSGYQRLLTFEVPGGGFSLFGRSGADEILTAYGILEFTDMAKVHHIDPSVIQRSKEWLCSRQNSDGSWKNHNELTETAYIAWALAGTGSTDKETDSALSHIRSKIKSDTPSYICALAANAFLCRDKKSDVGLALADRLRSRLVIEGNMAYLPSAGYGAFHSSGQCLDIETTALTAIALMKTDRHGEIIPKILNWISGQKDPNGAWNSTQATILAMKALIDGTEASKNVRTAIRIQANRQDVEVIEITPETSDLFRVIDLGPYVMTGTNRIVLSQKEAIRIPYQLAGTYWIPQKSKLGESEKALSIKPEYDKTHLSPQNTLECLVTVANYQKQPVNMAIVDLSIPPGFEVETDRLKALRDSGIVAKYEISDSRCILYVCDIKPKTPIRFVYGLNALYPVKVSIPPFAVYDYYNPQNKDDTAVWKVVVSGE